METRASYILVGGFVLVFFAGIIGAVLWLAGVEIDERLAEYDVFFDGSISGLKEGNAVRYRGVPIGAVKRIDINRDNVEQIQVTIEIQETVPIKEDAVASLEYQGITGVAFIQLSGGTNQAPVLTAKPDQDRPVIPSKASQLEQLFKQAPELLERFIGLVDRAGLILSDENIRSVTGVLGNVDSFTGALTESSADIQDILSESAGTLTQLRTTMSEAETLLAAFSDRSERLAELTEGTLEDASKVIESAVGAMANVEAMTVEGRDMINEIRPMIADTRTTLGTVNETAASLRDRIPEVADITIGAMTKTRQAAGVFSDFATPFANRSEHLAKSAQDTAGEAGKLLKRVRGSIDNADSLMTAGEKLLVSGEEFVSGATPAVDATASAMGKFGELAAELKPHVSPIAGDASMTLKEFATIAGELKVAATNIASAAGAASSLLEDNRAPLTDFANNGLFEFTQLITELRVLATSLSRISSQIEQDPARFFFGDSQQGFEAQ